MKKGLQLEAQNKTGRDSMNPRDELRDTEEAGVFYGKYLNTNPTNGKVGRGRGGRKDCNSKRRIKQEGIR